MSREPIDLVEAPRAPGAPEDPRTSAVKRALAALVAGDAATVASLCHEDLRYVVGGRSLLAGEHRGPAALTTAFARLAALCDEPPRFETAIWLSAGPHVHAVGDLVARRGGREARFAQAHVFEVGDDARLRTGRIYQEDPYGFDAVFG